jgi:hypothetical protein
MGRGDAIWVLGALVCLAMPVWADAAPSFAKDVAPILAANCAGCHASNVAMGTLDLDTFAGLQKGGHSGPVIVPGKSAESLLYLRITGAVTPAMPLSGKKLADGEIEIIRKWIDAGANPPAPGEAVAKTRPADPRYQAARRSEAAHQRASLSPGWQPGGARHLQRGPAGGTGYRQRSSPRFPAKPKTCAPWHFRPMANC